MALRRLWIDPGNYPKIAVLFRSVDCCIVCLDPTKWWRDITEIMVTYNGNIITGISHQLDTWRELGFRWFLGGNTKWSADGNMSPVLVKGRDDLCHCKFPTFRALLNQRWFRTLSSLGLLQPKRNTRTATIETSWVILKPCDPKSKSKYDQICKFRIVDVNPNLVEV